MAKKTSRKQAKKSAKKAKASKRAMPKRAKTKAAKKKVAARSAASRKAKPAKPRSRLATAGIIARGAGATVVAAKLNVHEAIEEQLLYPALRPHAEAHAIVLEGIEEHHVADIIIKELHHVRKDNEKWGAKFKVLKESVEHHIQEEERRMFPVARGVIPREELLALGARMRALKAELEK